MAYNYYKRRIETAQAKRAAKAVDTALVLNSAHSQYNRPILAHAGPSPFLQLDGNPCEWPWAHFDETQSERNIVIETGTFWPLYPRFKVRVNLFLIGTCYGTLKNPKDAMEAFSLYELKLYAKGYQYVNGSSTAIQITDFSYRNIDSKLYVAREDNNTRPALAAIAHGYNINSFDIDGQKISTDLRSWMLYEDEINDRTDTSLIHHVSFEMEFDMDTLSAYGTFSQLRSNPVYIDVELESETNDIVWHGSFETGKPNNIYRESKYCRLFCVGSSFTISGV